MQNNQPTKGYSKAETDALLIKLLIGGALLFSVPCIIFAACVKYLLF